jgi:hypothetical protein
VLAAGAAAQPPQESLPELVTAAQAHIAAERLDEATLLLWRAQEALGRVPDAAMHDAIAETVRDLLHRADPLDGVRVATDRKAAGMLSGLAKSYAQRKWINLAAALFDEAERLASGSTAKDRKALGKLAPSRASPAAEPPPPPAAEEATAPPPLPSDLLQQKDLLEKTGDWKRDETGAHSPIAKKDPGLLLLKAPVCADGTIRVEMLIGATGKAALAFGVADKTTFLLAELNHYTPVSSVLSLFRVVNRVDVERVAEVYFDDEDEEARGGWIELRVDVNGSHAVASTPGATVEADFAEPVRGTLGVHVSENEEATERMHFRNLCYEPVAEAAAPPEPEPADRAAIRVRERLALARTMLEQKNPEDAALELQAARRELAEVRDHEAQGTLGGEIEELLARHDPLHDRAVTAQRGIAELYLTLAKKYEAAERPQAALSLVARGRSYDRTAKAKPDASSTLRAWFERGRQLGTAGWTWDRDQVAAPQLESGTSLLVAKKKSFDRGRLAVDVLLHEGARAGIVFAMRDEDDYHLFSVQRRAIGMSAAISRWQGGEWRIVEEAIAEHEAHDVWIPLVIEATGDQMVLRAGAVISFELPRAAIAWTNDRIACGLGVVVAQGGGSAQFRISEE